MRLFIREHVSLIVIQCIQLGLILLIFWLDGYKKLKILSYGIFIWFVILVIYLSITYIRRRDFYERLSKPVQQLDHSMGQLGPTPVSGALDKLLKKQYRLYEAEIQESESRQAEHLLFMDRWVHQMKTPLSVIDLTAQTLDEPDSSSIREETERIKIGLETVLYMARLRTITEDFHIKPVMLSELVHEVNQENKRFYIRNQVYPSFVAERSDIKVETDEKWLFFILTQLIQNAVKYSAVKSDQIQIKLYERKGEAILQVKDYGVGIPAEDRKRIFSKFYTGENGRTFRESTGMGLYLVQEVAAELGHKIELLSEVGIGSMFQIVFTPSQNLTKL